MPLACPSGKDNAIPGELGIAGEALRRARQRPKPPFPGSRGKTSTAAALCQRQRALTFRQHLVHRHLVAADAEDPADVPAAGATAAAAAAAGARPRARAALLATRVEKLLHVSGASSCLLRGARISLRSRAPSLPLGCGGPRGRPPGGAERSRRDVLRGIHTCKTTAGTAGGERRLPPQASAARHGRRSPLRGALADRAPRPVPL